MPPALDDGNLAMDGLHYVVLAVMRGEAAAPVALPAVPLVGLILATSLISWVLPAGFGRSVVVNQAAGDRAPGHPVDVANMLHSPCSLGGHEMLKRIELIKSVGLFANASGRSNALERATLIYGENGRGKSTLAATLDSCSKGDHAVMLHRSTIDANTTPEVKLQFQPSGTAVFSNGAWNTTRTELVVFDAAFVERNVYSGANVSPEHRKLLLEFALGSAAVDCRRRVDDATVAAVTANAQVRQITDELGRFHPGITLAHFERLPIQAEADNLIDQLKRRIASANSRSAILARPLPSTVVWPPTDFASIFLVLGETLEDVEKDAESSVRDHAAKHGGKAIEAWIAQGLQFNSESECPYCGQQSVDLPLLKAYRTFFNNGYRGLKVRVSQLPSAIAAKTDEYVVERVSAAFASAAASWATWAEHVTLPHLAHFDGVSALKHLSEVRDILRTLADAKATDPLASVGTTELRDAISMHWEAISSLVSECNLSILAAREGIIAFRSQLVADNVAQLQAQVAELELARVRHSDVVVQLFDRLSAARLAAKTAEADKRAARSALDRLTDSTLSRYQEAINKLLRLFGASFSIAEVDANFLGGTPRLKYFLQLRGKSIDPTGVPSFGTALSEGDKRTLGFAFFLATVLEDPQLSSRVVVIDDPMCSFDANRRNHTKSVLVSIARSAAQLIVLAHDLFFLRDLRDALSRSSTPIATSLIRLTCESNGYTDFKPLDLDRECESPYLQHHRTLTEVVSGTSTQDARSSAKAIRPLLEGYLHRRFPNLIPKQMMLGQALGCIRSSPATSPLAYAQSLVDEIGQINDYAGQFHHDTNPGNADSSPVAIAELTAYAQRALDVVYRGTV